MEQSAIALIIMAVTLVLYATELIPIVVTSILSVAAMIFAGILTPAQGFSGFSNTATLLAGSAMVLGETLTASGATKLLGKKLDGMIRLNKRGFNTLLCGFSAVLSAFLSSISIILILMPMVDSIIVKSNYKFNKRESYMPIAIGASIGGSISLTGSSSVLTASAMYNQYVGYDAIKFFTPAILAVPATLGAILFYATFGTKLSEKWFDFEESPIILPKEESPNMEAKQESGKRAYLSILIFAVCAICWVVTDLNLALIAMLGTCVCFVTGCIEPHVAFSKISWSSVIVLAATLGFASGIHESGADEIIVNFLIRLCGPISKLPLGMFIIILLLTIFLTNIMSNTGAAAIVTPIAITLAKSMGVDAMLWCIAVGVVANCAVATPIGCACMTVLLPAGYRFKDFVKPGVCVCVISAVLICVTYVIVG